jgi:hypothetical protein
VSKKCLLANSIAQEHVGRFGGAADMEKNESDSLLGVKIPGLASLVDRTSKKRAAKNHGIHGHGADGAGGDAKGGGGGGLGSLWGSSSSSSSGSSSTEGEGGGEGDGDNPDGSDSGPNGEVSDEELESEDKDQSRILFGCVDGTVGLSDPKWKAEMKSERACGFRSALKGGMPMDLDLTFQLIIFDKFESF